MKIHKEGRTLLLVLLLILIVANLLLINLLPDRQDVHRSTIIASAIFYLLILQFFRNPRVLIEGSDELVLAPADGKVVVIEEVEEHEYFHGARRLQISIFMSPLNVHINRNPVSGIIKYFKYHAGQYLVAWHPKSSTDNERTTVVVELQNGLEVMVRQIAGAMARRIKWYVDEGDMIKQGEEFGFIKFGSRVDVFLPIGSRVKVAIGDKTKAGRTVIAELYED
ncbi:phosphatidylserine decarboxylase family protein [Catalinimonas niigatensis]|uniref:phosphatidylserine decarboxylase family protein n=1 Tax=Catalinimonas niigatensis TaxID=1397264 RepID=UPI002665039B|nr:phosphatidylserine decarboxylase family protein [Catalinimonas niigatensis]WPP48516.1 phosphatidylserine decarboxylase family protein [Catalinimonas niigatensis]